MKRVLALLGLTLLTSCLGDPAGPGVLAVWVEGAGIDTVWAGAPGEALPAPIRVHVADAEGRPLAAASLTWAAFGRGAQVVMGTTQTDRHGIATAGWLLGTDAAEAQQLRVTVRSSRTEQELVIRARAVPHVVQQVRVALDTPAVVRLGDTLPVHVIAIDPFGNEFPAPDVVLSVADSAVAAVASGGVRAGPRRGQTTIRAISGSVATAFALQVKQYVAAIEPGIDVIQFSALGAELPVAYVVRDDRGRVVADTTVAIAAADSSIVLVTGGTVRAVTPGITSLRLSLGPASATMLAGVQQKVGSLRLVRDTIRLNALMDTTTITPVVHDSLGSPIPNPPLAYDVSDREVARFAAQRTLEALKPGAALVTVRDSVTGISTSANVVVRQVVTSIALSQPEIVFDAIADSTGLSATAHDRLGSAVPGTTFEYLVSDTSVVTVDSLNQLHAVGAGQASVTARDPGTGTVATVPVRVDQVATGLSVTVMFGNPIITLSAGDTLPLVCVATDRNGYPIGRETALLGSLKGTVSGAGCGNAIIQRSGYDTLTFAMGSAQARVPVIVATRPDSVAVLVAALPLATDDSIRFVGEDLTNPSILALRPLVADIMADYGNPTNNLDRARAIRDWVARHAIYPDSWLRPDTTTANLSVLPAGKTWADVNRLQNVDRWNADVLFWKQFSIDGYRYLDRLLGTLDRATGQRAQDGMMEHVGGSRYRIRDVESYHYFACSFQSVIANALWAAAGLHGTTITVLQHDPSAVFIPELARWVYEDPTYNEEYLLDGVGEPLSPLELLNLSTVGQGGRLRPVKMEGPRFDPAPYQPVHAYVDPANHPEGMIVLGAPMNKRWVDVISPAMRYAMVDVPALRTAPAPWGDPNLFFWVSPEIAFPMLAPLVVDVQVEDSVQVVRLASTFPNHQRFERRIAGQGWESVSDVDVLPVGATKVEYRSVDAVGSISASAVLDVWAPRTETFIQTAPPGSLRAQARLYISP